MSVPALSETERDEALARLALLRLHLEDGVALTQIASESSRSVRTIQRWARAFREHGLADLVRKPRTDLGQRRLPTDLVRLIVGLALRRPPPTAATVWRQAESVAKAQDWPLPSYRTVYDIIRRFGPALVTLAHEGDKAYSDAYDLIYRREAARPNDIWQADHTLLDIWVLDHRDRPIQPWLTVVMDDFSRGIAGYAVTRQPPHCTELLCHHLSSS